MHFWSFGPFEVDLSQDRSHFWAQVREEEEWESLGHNRLCHAIGCYVFLLRYGDKYRPFYVGKTNAKSGFYSEIFAPHKLDHYQNIISEHPRHTPLMLLFPLRTPTWTLSRAYVTNRPLIEWMERILIGMALAKNPDLYNRRDTKNLKNCIVDGVFGKFSKSQRYEAALVARQTLTDLNDWD